MNWKDYPGSDFLIELIIYMALAAGSVLVLRRELELVVLRIRLMHRLKKSRSRDITLPKPLDYFANLVDVSFESDNGKYSFLFFEFAVFVVSYLLSYKNFNPAAAVLIAFVCFMIPPVFLAVRLEKERTRASFEGVDLVSELYRQYRINKLNIYEAIEQTSKADGDFNLSQKRLLSLLLHMRSACGPYEIRDAVNRFSFSFGTSWAKMLGQCIRIAAEQGSDISKGLADIAKQLKDASELLEQRKVLNSEASRMTLFMVPVMYIACMLTAVFYLGIDPFHLISNQFLNPTGYLLLLINVFLFLVNVFTVNVLTGFRLDY